MVHPVDGLEIHQTTLGFQNESLRNVTGSLRQHPTIVDHSSFGHIVGAPEAQKPLRKTRTFHMQRILQQKRRFSYEANKLLHAPNHRSDGSDRRFPNIFGITTTAELPERGDLGRSRFFDKDCNNISVLSVAISIPLLGAIILAQRTDDLC